MKTTSTIKLKRAPKVKQSDLKVFIIKNKHRIYTALNEPETRLMSPTKYTIVKDARMELGYSNTTNSEVIWGTIAKRYYEV